MFISIVKNLYYMDTYNKILPSENEIQIPSGQHSRQN